MIDREFGMSDRREPAEIEGVVLRDRVALDGERALYRGTREGYEYTVQLYVGSPAHNDEALRTFRREAALRASIEHPLIPTSFDVGLDAGYPFLIREWVDGRPLSEALDDGPMGEQMALVVGGAVAGALSELHEQGRIHGRLDPGRVLMSESGEIKLVECGLAVSAEDRRSPVPADRADAYTAPEQIAENDRAIDSRADLYALGVLLFELINGQPPVDERDDEIDSPASARPRRLSSRASPELDVVIRHLVAADPAERYQFARQVEADLNGIQAAGASGETDVLDLGTSQDSTDRNFDTVFVGREAEFERLRRAWARTREGEGELVVVQGPPGSGKTRLVEEWFDEHGGEVPVAMVGRSDQGATYPFAPFRDAIEAWLEGLEQRDDAAADRALGAFDEAAGRLGGVLRKVSPRIAEVVDADDDLLIQRDADDVVCNALASLLWNLSERMGGLVLWIDDIQWLDRGSLDVLEVLAEGLADRPMLVVTASRTDPASAEALAEFRRRTEGVDRTPIEVESFRKSDLERFVREELGDDVEQSGLVEQLAIRSGGNPLFVEQDLWALKDAGVLAPEWGTWRVADEALEASETPSDVLDSFMRRVEALDEMTQSVLKTAAVVGDEFDLDVIRELTPSSSPEDVNRAVGRAVAAHLLERTRRDGRYGFPHDRIRDALRSMLRQRGELAELHLRVARYLDSQAPLDETDVYRRAHHYLGADVSAADDERVFEARLAAAEVAAEDYAFERAHEFLGAPDEVVGEIEGRRALDYFRLVGRVAFETSRLDETVEYYRRAVELSDDPVQRARFRTEIARALAYGLHGDRAREEASRAFRELDFELPTDTADTRVGAVVLLLWHWLVGMVLVWTGVREGSVEGRERARQKTLVQLFDVGFHVGYFQRNRLFALQSAVCTVRPAHYLGPSAAYSTGFITYATTMGMLGWEEGVDRYGHPALEAAEAHGGPQSVAKAKQMFSGAKSACGALREAEEISRPLLEDEPEWLDTSSYLLFCLDLTTTYSFRGYDGRNLPLVERALERLDSKDAPFWRVYRALFLATGISSLASLGRFEEAEHRLEEVRRLEGEISTDRALPWEEVWGFVVNYHLQRRDFGPAFERAIRRHDDFGVAPEDSVHHSKYFYLYQAYARLEIASNPDEHGATRPMEELDAAVEQLADAASIPALTCHLRAAEGGRARLRGQTASARQKLRRAESIARDEDVPWATFEAVRQRALLFEELGEDSVAARAARQACEIGAELGRSHQVERLCERFELEGWESGDDGAHRAAPSD
ncbi:MAG: AAA family ATPase [Bradymonadaceae bacterium]